MEKSLFYIAGAIAILGIIAGIYFLIPGIYHPYLSLQSGHLHLVDAAKHPGVVYGVHRFYAAATFIFALIFIAIAYFKRPEKARRA
ncbi:MAG TPA: hypothetical protein VK140_07155 [Ktedonobacteraceae bacterium]|nr:hypothetical protein [Ktedonobacteraceae bacterium]